VNIMKTGKKALCIVKGLQPQNGSAAVEALLLIGVLVIFMIGIPMLGSMVDLKQKTIEASRYAAWEKTIHTNSNPAVEQIDNRFFKHESAPILSLAPNSGYLGENSLWGGITKQQNPATKRVAGFTGRKTVSNNLPLFQRARITADVANLRTYVGQGVSEWSSDFPSNELPQNENNKGNQRAEPHKGLIYSAIGKTVTELGSFVSKDGWGNDSPFSNGLMRSEIEIKVENNEIMNIVSNNCSQGGAGCFQESTAILVDGWSSADPNVIRDRVHGFVPSARLEKVGDFISKVSVIPMMGDLDKLRGSFGCVKLGVRPAKNFDALPTYEEVSGDNC